MAMKIRVSILANVEVLALAILAISNSHISHAAGLLVDDQERTYKVIDGFLPTDVIKIVEVKNLQSPNFPEGIEIVVKNLTNKPIYGITLFIIFPDTMRSWGSRIQYGESRLGDYRERPAADAEFIKPGETGIVRMERPREMGFSVAIKRGDIPVSETYNITIHGQVVNFGDGTGYVGKKFYSK